MRIYLMQLKTFFSIGIREGVYYIRPKNIVYHQPWQASENDNYAAHNVDVICRRNRIQEAGKKEKKDVCTLMKQYRNLAQEVGQDIVEMLMRAVEGSLELAGVRILKPKLVHKLLREELNSFAGV